MRRMLVPVLLLCVSASAFALQTIERKAPITQVTIYNDRCEITRSVREQLQPGEYQIKLPNCPVELDENSVRAMGRGSAAAKIAGVKIETVYQDTMTNAGLKAMQDSLVSFQDQRQSYDDRIGLLQKELDYLERIKQASTEHYRETTDDKQKTPQPQWTALYAFYDARHEAANKEIRQIERNKRDLERRAEALQHRIDRHSHGDRRASKQILVNVTAAEAGALDLDVSYIMLGASWHPLYDIRVSPDDRKVEFSYFGMIYQRTGEDWKDVKVVLSTAQPSLSGEAPEAKPWYVDIAQYYYHKGMNEQQARMNLSKAQANVQQEVSQDMLAGAAAAEINLNAVTPATMETQDLGTSYVFTTPGTSDIPSDGEPHKVPIAFETLDAEFEYVATPRIKPLAYLKGRVKNTTEYPLISGDINVFFGNSFVGSSALATVVPSEKFNVSLGVDPGIKVTRQKVKDLTEGSKKIKRTYAYKITIKNLKKDAAVITISEQYPVSKNDKIKVKLVSPDFDDEKEEYGIKQKPNGIIEWKMKLSPQESKDMMLEYQVEYPNDSGISGL